MMLDYFSNINLAFELENIFRLLLAVILGFSIGYERKRRYKEAGIRTHTIVCLGSALIMLVSIYGFDGASDAGRVAAQIVSGVGFLGAGIIVYRKHETKGLTTAAGVWTTAGVGMACGGGLYILAVVASALMISAQLLFHTNFRLFKHKLKFTIEIVFYQVDDENNLIKKEFGVDRFNSLLITRQGERLIYSATLLTEREHRSAELTKIMKENPFIISLRRCDD